MRPALDPAGQRVPRVRPTSLSTPWRPPRHRPFAPTLHLHQCKSSRTLHLQYSAKSQSPPHCQSLITARSDHPPVLGRSGPQRGTAAVAHKSEGMVSGEKRWGRKKYSPVEKLGKQLSCRFSTCSVFVALGAFPTWSSYHVWGAGASCFWSTLEKQSSNKLPQTTPNTNINWYWQRNYKIKWNINSMRGHRMVLYHVLGGKVEQL
jgi:hypothetical protein